MDSAVASTFSSLRALAPEVFLLGGSCGAFVVACSTDVRARRRAAETLLGASTLAALVATLFAARPSVAASFSAFGGLLHLDGWVTWVRLLALAGLAVTLVLSHGSPELDAGTHPKEDAGPEYLGLLGAATAAASLMAAASDILTAFLAIELASLPSYLLVAFRRRSSLGAEAALKYVVYGSVASGVSLFGFSWLYGAARATAFTDLTTAFVHAPGAATVGALLVLAGLAFKLAAVPFHMWCPDAYEGAPLPVAMFLSLVPKAGALVLLGRFSGALHAPVVTCAVACLAGLSMTWGNVAALAQVKLRRLLAYSAIAHAGTMLLGFLTSSPEAATALVIYLAAYLCMNLVAFLAVAFFAASGAETLADYRGLGARAPLASVLLTIALFSLTGLPPLAGFLGKYTLFAALVSAGLAPGALPSARPLLLGLVTLGVLNTVVALGYYARVVKALYFETSRAPSAFAAPSAGDVASGALPRLGLARAAVMVLLTAGTLGLGLAPGRLLAWAGSWAPAASLGRDLGSPALPTLASPTAAPPGPPLRDPGPTR